MGVYESEARLEDRMIDQLVKQGYSKVVINDVNELEQNFREQVNIHNKIELKGKNLSDKEDKSAYFICLIVKYNIDGTYDYYEGKTMGKIISEERGKTDFGYDCIFLSNDLNKTFGEATEEEKNSVSHRKRALNKLLYSKETL